MTDYLTLGGVKGCREFLQGEHFRHSGFYVFEIFNDFYILFHDYHYIMDLDFLKIDFRDEKF